MSDKIPFDGTVIRMEPGGFGIIHFDQPLGVSANNYGIISRSNGTSLPSFGILRPGVRVRGTAQADSQHELATVETLVIV